HTRFSRDWSSDVCSSDLFSTRPSGPSPSSTWPTPSSRWVQASSFWMNSSVSARGPGLHATDRTADQQEARVKMPDSLKAILISRDENKKQSVEMVDLTEADLKDCLVDVAVEVTLVNYKICHSVIGKLPVVLRFPLVAGIDFMSTVQSPDQHFWRKLEK